MNVLPNVQPSESMDDKIKWTDQAKQDHEILRRKADIFAHLDLDHKYVRTFRAIEEALKQGLPGADCSGHMRSGTVSRLYGMPLESAVVWYKLDGDGSIHILLIDSDHKSLMPVIRRDLEGGKLNWLLKALGIKPPLEEIETDNELLM